MGRSRTGTSEINRRKFIEKTTKNVPTTSTSTTTQPASRPTPQTTVPPTRQQVIVPASTNINAAGLVVAAPGASDIAQGKKPVSTTLIGQEIKVDEEGRQDIEHLKADPSKPVEYILKQVEGYMRGLPVATSQMVGIGKNIAYGVDIKDQAVEESGLDLLINPLIKPYTDERMKTEGVISDEWYFPEELKSDYNFLPPFMQKSDTIETRSFIEGASANLGNIGAISQAPLAGQIRDKEFGVSGERFMSAPGYYVGTAVGEIPYFLIGLGEIKAVATVAAKTSAGVIRGSVHGTTGLKLVRAAYAVEQAATKLQKVVNLGNTKGSLTKGKVTGANEIIKAKDTLVKGYAKNIASQEKAIAVLEETKKGVPKGEQGKIEQIIKNKLGIIKSLSDESTALDKQFGKDAIDKINKIENLETRTSEADLFNMALRNTDKSMFEGRIGLLPKVKVFKDEYLAQSLFMKAGTKSERLASFIEGSPKDVATTVNKFLNRPGRAKGDPMDVLADKLLTERTMRQAAEGKYSGIMGKLILDKDLWGGAITTSLGIDRATGKLNSMAGLISRTVPMKRVIPADSFHLIGKIMDERTDVLNEQNIFLKQQIKQGGVGADGAFEGINIPELTAKVKSNEDEIMKIFTEKQTLFEPLSYVSPSGTAQKGKGIYKDQTTDWVFDFPEMTKAFPEIADEITSRKINLGAQPEVNIRKIHGILIGDIRGAPGPDGTLGGYSFAITKMGRKDASKTDTGFGEQNLSQSNHWIKNIGLRNIGPFKTLIPRKGEQMEDIITLYKADDSLQSTSGKLAAVRNIISIGPNTPKQDIDQLKTTLFAEEITPTDDLAKLFPNRILLQYRRIEQEKIAKTVEGTKNYEVSFVNVIPAKSLKEPKYKSVGDILKQRALAENRPEQALGFISREKELIGYEIDNISLNKFNMLKGLDKQKGGALNINEQKLALKISDIESTAQSKLDTLNSRLVQLNKFDDSSRLTELYKGKDIHEIGSPKGTMFRMPVEILRREDDLLTQMYKSEMVIDNRTKKQYYKRGSDTFEVVGDFNPARVTSSDRAVAQLGEYDFYPGVIDSQTGKGYGETVPVFPGMDSRVSEMYDQLSKGVSKNTIFINKPETYKGILKKLTAEEVSELEFGTNFGKLFSKSKSSLEAIDQKPKQIKNKAGVTVIAKQSKLGLIKQNTKVLVEMGITKKVESLTDTRTKINKILFGDRFSRMSTQDLRPDSNTYKDRTGKIVGDLTKGTSEVNTGYNTKLRAMFGAGDDPSLVQGGIPPGVKVNPFYDAMSYSHNVIDIVPEPKGNSNKQLSKQTHYQQLLSEAKTQGVEQAFKVRMAQLVRTNVMGGKKYKKHELDDLFAKDETGYINDIQKMVDTPGNKYLRISTDKQRRILKGKNDKKKKKVKVIDYSYYFPELNIINTKNPIKRGFDDLKSQMPRAATEWLQTKITPTKLFDIDGKPLPGPNIINRIFRDISRRRNKPGSVIPTENPMGPMALSSIKTVLKDLGPDMVESDKFLSKLDKHTIGATQMSQERALEAMYKGQAKPIGSTKRHGIDHEKLSTFVEEEPTPMDHDFDVVRDIYGPGDKDLLSSADQKIKDRNLLKIKGNKNEINNLNNKPTSSENNIRISKLKAENIKLEDEINKLPGQLLGAPQSKTVKFDDGSSIIKNQKPTQEASDAIVRAMIFKHLGMPINVSTSTSRASSNLQWMALVNAGVTEAKLKGMFSGSGADSAANINAFFGTSKGKELLLSPEFRQVAKTQSDSRTVMKQVPDSIAEKLGERTFSAMSMDDMMKRFGKVDKKQIGLGRQAVAGSTFMNNVESVFGTETGLTQQQDTQPTEGFSLYPTVPDANATPFMINPQPKNIIDQTIGDIQNTMAGIVTGTKNIGKGSNGDVRSYEMSQSLNIFGSSSIGEQTKQSQSSSLLGGLQTGERYGYVTIPDFTAALGIVQQEKSRVKQAIVGATAMVVPSKSLLVPPPIIPPKVIPARVIPTALVPFAPYIPGKYNRPPLQKFKKGKKKKTWWQTPENWYEPYYWGGKDQMGAGYVTFTGKEPGKVKKYEKKFFGIGVNDSPFGIRSKNW